MHASPIFAQRKPNGKLRLLVDLRKINSLIADDYTNNNHPVSTLSRRSTRLGREVTVLQTRLLKSLSLFADGGPAVSGNALHSILLAEILPIKDLHKVLADLCVLFKFHA